MLRRVGVRNRATTTTPWVVAQDNPPSPDPVNEFRLFAIIGAWMEQDVIAATVANAFTQGCDRVLLVDNESPDHTVREAIRAGAELAESFHTEHYDEVVRLDIMNRVVHDVSVDDGSEHIWWLWLDADEFPHAARGATIREYLERVDRRFRIVGARFINHFPSAEPAYISGFHPLDFQALCEEHRFGCRLRHRKHPLQRFDRGGTPIVCDRGFHRASSRERPLLEPTEAVYLHHFPYRDPPVTRARLAMLCDVEASGTARARADDDAADGMIPRFQTLDAVYRGDWGNVRNYRPETPHSTAQPIPWTSLAPREDQRVKRWYTDEDLADAFEAFRLRDNTGSA